LVSISSKIVIMKKIYQFEQPNISSDFMIHVRCAGSFKIPLEAKSFKSARIL